MCENFHSYPTLFMYNFFIVVGQAPGVDDVLYCSSAFEKLTSPSCSKAALQRLEESGSTYIICTHETINYQLLNE